jgi:acyl-CoA thioester hydrolase
VSDVRGVYVHRFDVPPDAIDVNGHVNNLAYLRWMQDIATAHSSACGWPLLRYLETRTSWVVRSHHIEYERPAFAGESLTALTWIRAFGARSSPRRYAFWRASDRALLAKAETMWVFVDGRLGKPARIPEDFRSAFELVPDEKAVLQALDAGALA